MAAVRGVNASNYVTAGKAAAQNFITTSGAILDNSPKYDKIGKQQVVDNYKLKQTAMQADQLVAEEGIKAEARVRKAKIQADRDLSIASSKMEIRKAGVVAAAGKSVADALTPEPEPYRPPFELTQAYIDRVAGKIDQREADLENDPNMGETAPTPPAGYKEWKEGGGITSTKTETDGSFKPIKVNSGTPVSQQTVYQGLLTRGLSEQDAKIGSAVMMGESGGKYWDDTVQSGLDVNKKNEFSVGLMQINTHAHMDKLNRRGWKIDDLRDPDKNLDIAVEVFNEAGGRWTPWAAYTKGSYQSWL